MDINEIRKLIDLMAETGVTELEVKDAEGHVRLVLGGPASVPPQIVQAAPAVSPQAAAPSEPPAAGREPDAGEAGPRITSPMVGTFYQAPGPDAKPFVSVGDVVEAGDVVCIIEAMKMMNEIESEQRGRLRRVLVENGQPVEYGQALFLLEPV